MTGLSIVVPCYNESSRGMFECRINEIRSYIKTFDFPCQLIFVNDGSIDDTEYILMQKDVDYVGYDKNKGKGYALRRGIAKAVYDKVLIMDADLSVPLQYIPEFYILCENNIVVIGTRVFEDKRNPFRKLLTKLSKRFSNDLFNLNVRDSQCGFKMFSKESYDKVSENFISNRWLFDIELLYYLKDNGSAIMESNVRWINFPKSTLNSFSALFSSGIELLKILHRRRIYERKKNS